MKKRSKHRKDRYKPIQYEIIRDEISFVPLE